MNPQKIKLISKKEKIPRKDLDRPVSKLPSATILSHKWRSHSLSKLTHFGIFDSHFTIFSPPTTKCYQPRHPKKKFQFLCSRAKRGHKNLNFFFGCLAPVAERTQVCALLQFEIFSSYSIIFNRKFTLFWQNTLICCLIMCVCVLVCLNECTCVFVCVCVCVYVHDSLSMCVILKGCVCVCLCIYMYIFVII